MLSWYRISRLVGCWSYSCNLNFTDYVFKAEVNNTRHQIKIPEISLFLIRSWRVVASNITNSYSYFTRTQQFYFQWYESIMRWKACVLERFTKYMNLISFETYVLWALWEIVLMPRGMSWIEVWYCSQSQCTFGSSK